MRIAALIFGILAGLSSLPLATYAHGFLGLVGANNGSLFYLIPIASFVGAGLAINYPGVGGTFLALSAFALLMVGNNFGYAINVITIGPVVLNGVAALLAFIAAANSTAPDLSVSLAPGSQAGPVPQARATVSAMPNLRVTGSLDEPASSTTQVPPFDRARWNALVKYDSDIGRLAEKVAQLGPKWVDVFAADYLALNDKSYLPQIVQKLIQDAKADKEALERQRLEQEEAAKNAHAAELKWRERLREEQDSKLQDRAVARQRIINHFWGTPQRSLATNFVILVFLLGVGAAGWRYYNSTPRSYGGVFAYCKAVGTRDVSDIIIDPKWSGGEIPPSVIADRLNRRGAEFRWRCMDNSVYACMVATGRCIDKYGSSADALDKRGYPINAWTRVPE